MLRSARWHGRRARRDRRQRRPRAGKRNEGVVEVDVLAWSEAGATRSESGSHARRHASARRAGDQSVTMIVTPHPACEVSRAVRRRTRAWRRASHDGAARRRCSALADYALGGGRSGALATPAASRCDRSSTRCEVDALRATTRAVDGSATDAHDAMPAHGACDIGEWQGISPGAGSHALPRCDACVAFAAWCMDALDIGDTQP